MSSLTAYVKSSYFAPAEEKSGWITNSKAWNFVGQQNTIDNVFKFIAVPVSAGQTVTVKASDVNPTFMTMLSCESLNPVNGQPAGVVAGWNGPHNDYKGQVPISQTSSFSVPDNATFLWCCTKFYGAEAMPKSISVDGNEVVRNPMLD